jgi:PTH1 family peptidyl-tRNA hydrolase
MRIVVGLGNPGPDYAGTRHNVGYEVVEHLARHEGLLFRSPHEMPAELEGYVGPRAFRCARSFDPDALLVEPTTYMNLSGTVVAPLVRWAEATPENVLVVYDDLDLPLGAKRFRPQGGTGGHKGMRSILECLGTDRFPRLRVGIGRSGTDAARHVLQRFRPDERVEMDVTVAEASEALLDWLLCGDLEKCMTRFHSRWSAG